jgi:putative transposase
MLPHDFPPWDTVFGYFNRTIHHRLYEELRVEMGRDGQASAGVADSQSVKSTEKGA